jgi:carbon-monoxide dehydrogenase medium subunit
LNDFEYLAPNSLDAAVEILASRPSGVQLLAGGTDILVQLREGQREASLVVDVKKIPELMEVSWGQDGGLRLGAAVPCIRIYRDAQVKQGYPAVADAARIIGGWQIQSRASLGGNLCNASPAADSIPALIACGARCDIAGPGGPRSVAVEDFCESPGRTVLREGELLVRLVLPPPQQASGSRYLRFIPRNEMDIAVAGAGAWLQLTAAGDKIDAARIGLAAVGPTSLFAAEASSWLAGEAPGDESFRPPAELAKDLAKPIRDKRGPAHYRSHLVGVLTRRALEGAYERVKDTTS